MREALFERIQFTKPTTNDCEHNGSQQCCYLLVELFADVGPQRPDQWIKIASRMSEPIVVRGRPPGHFPKAVRGAGETGYTNGTPVVCHPYDRQVNIPELNSPTQHQLTQGITKFLELSSTASPFELASVIV